jgi:hypothetical protein
MMKRYIKTPLKYALPLLFIGSLVLVSISGCTSNENTPTATPTAQVSPTSNATVNGHFAFLDAFGNTYKERRTSTDPNIVDQKIDLSWNGQQLGVSDYYLIQGGGVSNIKFTVDRYATTAQATAQYNKLVSDAKSNGAIDDSTQNVATTDFTGTYTAVAGHAPAVYNSFVFHYPDETQYGQHQFYQFDNYVITVPTEDVSANNIQTT